MAGRVRPRDGWVPRWRATRVASVQGNSWPALPLASHQRVGRVCAGGVEGGGRPGGPQHRARGRRLRVASSRQWVTRGTTSAESKTCLGEAHASAVEPASAASRPKEWRMRTAEEHRGRGGGRGTAQQCLVRMSTSFEVQGCAGLVERAAVVLNMKCKAICSENRFSG